MNDLDEVRKRIQKRKGVKQPLNDDNFKRFYNFMIKFMVIIVVGLVSLSYLKLNPDSKLKEMILNDSNYKAVTSWISDTLFSFLPDEEVTVSSEVTYQQVDGDYFKNNSNEVLSMAKGRVIETGSDEETGGYVIVLGNDEVQITYRNIDNIMVTLYDEVEEGMILGSYQDQLVLEFEYLGKEISYQDYQGME